VVEAARREPQTVTKHGKPAVVVVAVDEYQRLRKLQRLKAPSFAELLLAMPTDGEEFERLDGYMATRIRRFWCLAAPLRNRDRDRIAANAGRDRARWGRTADDANCSLPGIKPSEGGCGPATEFRDEAVLWRQVGQRLFTLSKH
jgi:prevent-host-death family protein